jgi:hypothetical protein
MLRWPYDLGLPPVRRCAVRPADWPAMPCAARCCCGAVTQVPSESSHRTRSIAAMTAGSLGSSPSSRRAWRSSSSTPAEPQYFDQRIILSDGVRDFDKRRCLDACGRDGYVVLHHVDHGVGTGVGEKVVGTSTYSGIEINFAEVWQLRRLAGHPKQCRLSPTGGRYKDCALVSPS